MTSNVVAPGSTPPQSRLLLSVMRRGRGLLLSMMRPTVEDRTKRGLFCLPLAPHPSQFIMLVSHWIGELVTYAVLEPISKATRGHRTSPCYAVDKLLHHDAKKGSLLVRAIAAIPEPSSCRLVNCGQPIVIKVRRRKREVEYKDYYRGPPSLLTAWRGMTKVQ